MSCELDLIETTKPTGGTQNRGHWGGPTNGRAAACRRRLATAVKPLDAGALGSKLRPFSSMILFGPVFPPVPLLGLSHLGIAVWLRQGLSATVISFIPVHLLRCLAAVPTSTITAAATVISFIPIHLLRSTTIVSHTSSLHRLVIASHSSSPGPPPSNPSLPLHCNYLRRCHHISSAHFLLLKAAVLAVADGDGQAVGRLHFQPG